jgi:hypothetical protein
VPAGALPALGQVTAANFNAVPSNATSVKAGGWDITVSAVTSAAVPDGTGFIGRFMFR